MPSLLRISEGAAIALHAVCLLAKKPESKITTAEIAGELSVSETHLSKVMQKLVKGKIVASVRGPGGGFKLNRPSKDISMLDVFEVIESYVGDTNCILTPPKCTGSECIFGCISAKVNQLVLGFMKVTNFADIASSEGMLITSLECGKSTSKKPAGRKSSASEIKEKITAKSGRK